MCVYVCVYIADVVIILYVRTYIHTYRCCDSGHQKNATKDQGSCGFILAWDCRASIAEMQLKVRSL